jgi:GntR family transcriptional repressor for pyruvate dehydrogenase complex
MIGSGQLSPGDQLMPERRLAKELGVSRTALREALAALAAQGLIDVTPGGGARVRAAGLEDLLQPLSAVMLRRETVQHLLEARKVLEVEIVRLAAQRARPADAVEIRRAAEDMRDLLEAGREAAEADLRFHLALGRAAQNPVLSDLMGMLAGLMSEAYGPARRLLVADENQRGRFVQQHLAIAAAVEAADAERAARLMHEHLTSAEEDLGRLTP